MRLLRNTLIASMCLSTASCSIIEPVETLQFKITIVANTPEGTVTGSSIWGVQIRRAWLSNPNGNVRVNHFGEAVVIGNGPSPLFAIMHNEKPYNIIRHLMISEKPNANWHEYYSYTFESWKNSHREFYLDPEQYPIIVRFKDLNKPSSVDVIDTENKEDGISISSVHIKITAEELKPKLKSYLKWIETYDLNFDGEQFHTNMSDANGINRLDFIRNKW